MNYETMKKSHETQITALLDDDYETLRNMFFKVDMGKESHYHVWNLTGNDEHSLFAGLPNLCGCPVLIRQNPMVYDIVDTWGFLFTKSSEQLIPNTVNRYTHFDEEQLREFSRIQLEARYPGHD